ncbi:type II toxin-antitoxin system prevent-host-death family antitoxin [Pseudomonas sp. B21-015]|nr:type II toxin-antitoxin system prevent-host-death family antitoxin [Pseudomonas sp. B21-015]
MNRDIVVPLAEAKKICPNSSTTQPPGRSSRLPNMVGLLRVWVPAGKPCGQRIGAMKGKLVLPEDYDASLPDDLLNAFEDTQE